VLNHSFMVPTLVFAGVSVAAGLGLSVLR